MLAREVLQGIKRSIEAKGYVDFHIHNKCEQFYTYGPRTTYAFSDGSYINYHEEQNSYIAGSIFENQRGNGEFYEVKND